MSKREFYCPNCKKTKSLDCATNFYVTINDTRHKKVICSSCKEVLETQTKINKRSRGEKIFDFIFGSF